MIQCVQVGSTDLDEEEIEVGVKEETPAAAAADVRQPNQKVTQKPCVYITLT